MAGRRNRLSLYFTDDSQPYLDIMGLRADLEPHLAGLRRQPAAEAACGDRDRALRQGRRAEDLGCDREVPRLRLEHDEDRDGHLSGKDRGRLRRLQGRLRLPLRSNAFIFSFYRSSKKAISVRGGQNYVFGNTQVPKLQAIAYCR